MMSRKQNLTIREAMESLTPYQVDYEVTFIFLVVYAMCLCPVIYKVSSTRKQSNRNS
jgi:hypothetical protein